MQVLDPLAPALAGQERGNELHGPRPVERDRRRNVLEGVRLHLLQHSPHPGTFELEHAVGVGAADQLVSLLVGGRDVVQRQRDALVLGDQPQAGRHDVEVLQAKEVHLQEADLLHRVHVVLRDHLPLLTLADGRARPVLQRGELHQRLRRDDHPGGVHAHVARHALQ